jgi:hypothetical protein
LCERTGRIRVAIAEVSVCTGNCGVEATKWPWQVRPADIASDWAAICSSTSERYFTGTTMDITPHAIYASSNAWPPNGSESYDSYLSTHLSIHARNAPLISGLQRLLQAQQFDLLHTERTLGLDELLRLRLAADFLAHAYSSLRTAKLSHFEPGGMVADSKPNFFAMS